MERGESVAIRWRRGKYEELDLNKLVPGEPVVAFDNKYVAVCVTPGEVIELASREYMEEALETANEYAESAESSANSAASSASTATSKASEVAASASNAASSAAAAQTSDTNAAASASAATSKASEANASATNAASSAAAAQASENNAAASASTAVSKANESAESAVVAASSATEAQQSETNAATAASMATDKATEALTCAKTAESWAVGGTDTREGEDTDNSKYYSEQSKLEADRAKNEADRAASIANVDVAKDGIPGIVSPDGVTIKVDENGKISTVFDNSTGTESASGLTKLYSDIGTAADGTMTQKAIGEALDKCMTKDITILLDELGECTPASSGIDSSHPSILLATAAHGGGKFVTAGYANRVFHSSGGADWNKPSVCNMYNPNSIAYGNGTFVMVGNHMTEVGLLYSTDGGDTWSSGSGITDCTFLYGVTFGNGMFVVVGAGGKTFYSTDDGRTWDEGNGTGNDEMRAITFANGMFVAVGYAIYSSTDGKTWTKRRNADSAVKYAVTYGDGKFVAVASDGKTYYSTDGKTWLIGNGCGSVDLRGVAYGNGMFVAVGIGGCLFYSFDGISWIAGDSGVSKDLKAIAYAEGKFVIVGSSTVLYAEFATETKKLEDVIGELYNRNKIPYIAIKLAPAGWTSSTEYSSCPYVYEVSISDYYDSYPEWFLKPVSGIVPTSAEQASYDLITAMKLDTTNRKLKFYATEKTSTTILIVVKGVLG